MRRLVIDTWTDNYYQEQANGKWLNMGMSPQEKPIDTIEYSLVPKGLRFVVQNQEVTLNRKLLLL